MRRALPMLVTATLLAGACSGGSDDAADTTVPCRTRCATTTAVATPPTEAPTTTRTVTTEAPTTTIDEAALLAEAEAAYLEAFEVGKEIFGIPTNPDNEELLRAHFTGAEPRRGPRALRCTIDGASSPGERRQSDLRNRR